MYPVFIHEEETIEEITSMPGCYRLSLNHLLKEVDECMK